MFTVPLVPSLVPRPRGRRETWPGYEASLIPRPCPVMRKNGLVNQIEFLGLVGTLVTVHRSKHFVPNPLKKDTDVRVEIKKQPKKITVIRKVLRIK